MNNNAVPTLELDREVYIKMEAEDDLVCSAETMWVRKQNTCLSFLDFLFYSFYIECNTASLCTHSNDGRNLLIEHNTDCLVPTGLSFKCPRRPIRACVLCVLVLCVLRWYWSVTPAYWSWGFTLRSLPTVAMWGFKLLRHLLHSHSQHSHIYLLIKSKMLLRSESH